MSQKNTVGAVMIVGAGIGGCQAALDLGNSGFKVYLVEKSPSIGGVMAQLDKTFPTNDCSMCILAPKLVAVDRHPNIELITNVDIVKLDGNAGNFNATINKRTRYIQEDKCTGCGECVRECPVIVPDEFNEELDDRKAIYLQFPQAVPFKVLIDKKGTPPCKDACPAHVNAQGYVALISKKKYQKALNLVRERCPLPAVIGRICPHFCESACNRLEVDEAINICGLKRFVADYVRENIEEEITFLEDKKEDKVAVVGSGPAGLTVAYHLARRGYPVTIFEKESVAGGMLRLGIPDYRLPPEVLESDIDHIKRYGVEIKLNTPIGPDLTLDDLKKQDYKVIFIAIGLHDSRKMDFECVNNENVIYGVDFLKDLNLSRDLPDLKDKIIGVVGGGDVAMDAARSSIRLGAKKVIIIYRRSEQEMPASREEIEMAREEGIEFKFLTVPTKDTSGKKSNLNEIECIQMKLGEPDDSGRRRPITIEGSEFKMKIDTLILSIGQEPDSGLIDAAAKKKLNINKWGYIETNKVTYETNIPGVFAGGEIVTGAGSAIEAIGTGNKAAILIDKYLKGEEISDIKETIPDYKVEDVVTIADIKDIDNISCEERNDYTICLPDQRIYGFNEVSTSGMDEESAIIEANRCLNCGPCCECLECVSACLAGAVDHSLTDEEITLNVGAMVLATGFDEYEPEKGNVYGYGKYPNVITSIEFERILNASGPFKGEVIRPSDMEHPKKVAFLHCIGSRDKKHGGEYCSSVCCMYTTKEAVIAKEHMSSVEPTIFTMDIRSYGKDFDKYIERAKNEYGIRYIRRRVSSIKEIPDSNDLIIRYETEEGKLIEEIFELVILSVGIRPNKEAKDLAKVLDIELNEYGFCKTNTFNPVETTRAGVYVCGTFREPKDIPETVIEASAAAGCVNSLLHRARNSLITKIETPVEIDVSGQEPRIGVFVCHCGINIGGVVDVPKVVDFALTLPNVVYADQNLYTCSADTQTIIHEKIKEHKLNRVIVASCTPRTHEPLFQATVMEAGLNKYLFEMANIRDQCSWVHMHEPELATEKAIALVRMAVAKARELMALEEHEISVIQKGLVIGGGVAGMTAALNLANQGFETFLVEKESTLGGFAKNIHQTLENDDLQAFLKDLIKKVENHNLIQVFTSAKIDSLAGYIGNFATNITYGKNKERVEVEHGTVIVATGANDYVPREFMYGNENNVITQKKLEDILFKSDKIKKLKSIVMIQCVGSRNEEHPYCSRICCAEAIKNALKAKEINPNLEIVILYRDIRTYGFKEKYYNQAREKGIIFLRFDEEKPPELEKTKQGLKISINRPDIGKLDINSDLIVLSTGLVAPRSENEELARMLKVPLNEDKFFLEAHVKLRPNEFATDGVYLCGTAHSPKNIQESISQAYGAAAQAVQILSAKSIITSGLVATVVEENCIGCGKCAEVCPFNAIELLERERTFEEITLKTKKSHVNITLCKGCGTCGVQCPNSSILIKHFGFNQISAMIKAFSSKT